MTDLTVSTNDEPQPERSLSRLMPRNVKELAFFGNQAAASGLFKTSAGKGQGMRNLTGQEAFLLMSQGVELGLSPLQSLRELNIIDGRVDVPASVRAALICASPKVTQWDANATPQECTITAKRSDRATVCSVTVRKSDMNAEDIKRQASHVEDWLYARAVRKISRRYFPDFALGLGTSAEETYDPEKIIDVSRVEQAIDVSHQDAPYGHHDSCGGTLELHANTKTGGAFLLCPRCNATIPPPQEVRDVIRGEPVALTIAAPPEDPSLPEPEAPLPDGDSTDTEPAPDAPVDAAENGAGSPASEPTPVEAYDDPALVDAGSGDAQTGAIPPEPVAEATMEPSPSEAATPRAASPSPRDQLRAYLRQHRTATGPLHVAIRDALLDAGWDGTTGISQLTADLPDDAIAKLLKVFAAPSFGTVE